MDIKRVIENKTFKEIEKELTQEPYYLNIKQNETSYMLLFTENSDLTLPCVRQCTGIVFEKETNKLLHFSFEKCYNGFEPIKSYSSVVSKTETIEDIYKGKFDENYKINLYFSGSMIKLFFYKGDWVVSSSKILDAGKSFWGSKSSFKELFLECIENSYDITYIEFLEKLDTNYCYTYIIQHPELPNVIGSGSAMAFILNKVNLTTLEEEIPDIDNFLVEKSINQISGSIGLTENYLVYLFDSETKKITARVKVLSKSYTQLQELQGNYPNIGLRYLECFGNNIKKNELRQFFKNETMTFNKIDILFEKCIRCIKMSYQNVIINKTRTTNDIPKSHILIVEKLHQKFNRNININEIKEYLLGSYEPRELAYIICYIY
jgi:hypothetical protein